MIRTPLEKIEEGILPDLAHSEALKETSFLLLEEGFSSRLLPEGHTFTFPSDAGEPPSIASLPSLTCREVINLLFTMNRVVVL